MSDLKKKKIWIINHYASPPNLGINVRQYYFAKNLKDKYDFEIFCSSKIHNTDIQMTEKGKSILEKEYNEVKFNFIKNINYEGNGLKRVANMLEFAFKIFLIPKRYGKPDIIYGSSACPIATFFSVILSKIKGVKSIVEVRDLWPLSIVEYSNKWTNEKLIIRILYRIEKWMYQYCDALIFTMPGGVQYIKDKGWDDKINLDKVFNINNGVDIEEFDRNIEEHQIKDDDLEDSRNKIVYTGSIRKVNNVIEFAELGKHLDPEKYLLLIYGKGDYVEELESYIKSNGLMNVKYKGYVNKNEIPYILSKADMNYFQCKNSNVIFNYGMSPNKFFEYITSGKAVCMDGSSRFDFVKEYDLGISGQFNDKAELAQHIKKFFEDNNRVDEVKENNFKIAKEFDWKVLSKKFEEVVNYVEEH